MTMLTSTETLAPPPSEVPGVNSQRIVVGLVNNMPDAAIRATERQFGGLLQADGIEVALRYFHLPTVPRSETARTTFLQSYAPVEELWTSRIDGLIVTGAEPRAPKLQDEPYWSSLTRLVDWAEENTISTIWSCLAAHAAVLHLDRLERQPLGSKLFGVFDCVKAADHPIVSGIPQCLPVPHSRLNALNRDELVARNYQVITSSDLAGADMFLKQRKSLFIFFQGHLEYDAQTLLREYVRDVTRFVKGERETYPDVPFGYFDDAVVEEFERIRRRAKSEPAEQIIAALAETSTGKNMLNTWRGSATNIYRNWLRYLATEKVRQTTS